MYYNKIIIVLCCSHAGALDKQRQMYEEKIEELRNQMGPPMGRQAMERTTSIGSFSSGYGSSRMSWCEDR